jgi:putative spermidine/putrescine transport system substrate-binding protein
MRRIWACLTIALILTGCARPRPTPVSAGPALAGADWSRVEAEARGSEVAWLMADSSGLVNRYVDEFVAPQVYQRYGITVRRLPMRDAAAVAEDLANQRRAARPAAGRADLLWISGAEFLQARQAGALYGPWARDLPNARLVEWSEPSIAQDAGQPVGGYGAPWGQQVLAIVYDTARVAAPPATLEALEAWLKEHPGRFTYPQPPSPEGRAFIRQAFYELTGGYQGWQGSFDEAAYAAKAGPVWAYLERLAPLLWHEGREYPASGLQLEELYARGEVDFSLTYNPAQVWRRVQAGELPRTTSMYFFERGTLTATHYLAIPFNAPHKAAAVVLANWLESPEAQADKARIDVWGDLPVISAQAVQGAGASHASVLPAAATTAFSILRTRRLPQPPPALAERLDQDWARLIR